MMPGTRLATLVLRKDLLAAMEQRGWLDIRLVITRRAGISAAAGGGVGRCGPPAAPGATEKTFESIGTRLLHPFKLESVRRLHRSTRWQYR
jgi:hypothetical protein